MRNNYILSLSFIVSAYCSPIPGVMLRCINTFSSKNLLNSQEEICNRKIEFSQCLVDKSDFGDFIPLRNQFYDTCREKLQEKDRFKGIIETKANENFQDLETKARHNATKEYENLKKRGMKLEYIQQTNHSNQTDASGAGESLMERRRMINAKGTTEQPPKKVSEASRRRYRPKPSYDREDEEGDYYQRDMYDDHWNKGPTDRYYDRQPEPGYARKTRGRRKLRRSSQQLSQPNSKAHKPHKRRN